MTFWLYQPRQLFKSSSLIPFRSQDLGDVLNFLTIFLISFSFYLRKQNNDIWKKLLTGGILLLVFLGLMSGSSTEKLDNIDGIEIPKYSDYKFSLSVD